MTQLGKYELHEQLGKGSFGTVYRATDISLGRQVALKILHPQMAADAEFIERFRKEARLAAALESPYILTIYEVGEEGGRYFISMRYYPNGSLADLLKGGSLSLNQAVTILTQISEGLQKLHAKGWVHRDLKPSNILFDADGRAVVADFGLARALTSAGSSSSGTAGTPHYKAPELWRGKPPASPATDVYALGCILGEMLTGKTLFTGDTPDEVMTKHVLEGPEFGTTWPPSDVSPELQDFILRCLRMQISERPVDAASFSRELLEAADPKKGDRKSPPKSLPSETDLRIETLHTSRETPKITTEGQYESISYNPDTDTGAAKSPSRNSHSFSRTMFFLFIAAVIATGIYFRDDLIELSNLPRCNQAGLSRTSRVDGMEMVCVPQGEFVRGSDLAEDTLADNDELPQKAIEMDAYWIDQTEVTNAMYKACVTAGACSRPVETGSQTRNTYYGNPQYSEYPVIHVNWYQANNYCTWAGRRLPTEAEWEKAARGQKGFIYPWGNNPPNKSLLNFDNLSGDTEAVGSYPGGESPYQALDMAGNVWEWVADIYYIDYYADGPDQKPQGPQIGEFRVFRGGSWNSAMFDVRAANRYRLSPNYSDKILGFRCARNAIP